MEHGALTWQAKAADRGAEGEGGKGQLSHFDVWCVMRGGMRDA